VPAPSARAAAETPRAQLQPVAAGHARDLASERVRLR
jgi:hypothetical protein